MAGSSLSFLQSPEWQEIQERMGRPTRRVAGILVVRHDLPLGCHYGYVPRPVVDAASLRLLVEYGRSSGAIFLKIDPVEPLPLPATRFAAAHSLQPVATLYIDCSQPDGELRAAMHPKTRYNIGLARRRGVSVRVVGSPAGDDAFGAFWRLLGETADRDGFRPHPVEHYRILFNVRSNDFSNLLFLAELDGDPVAAAVVNCYRPSGTAVYLHGGSSRSHRAAMAPHFLHWHIIQYLRHAGFIQYDLGGVDAVRWPGVTRFKRGFGGRVHAFPPAVDIPFRALGYRLYRLQHSLRRLL
ncbi:MAG: peptidoglycan bridge formation glycyltransferase FemA/FemB family protein [bacterium]|nr:peptidoglycan bridge formation glycyltransferase FemA/FemB family protein [bacterium]